MKPGDPQAIADEIKDVAEAFVANPTEQVMLKIGNVLAALGGITDDKPLDVAGGLGAAGGDALGAKLGALGAALTTVLKPTVGAAGATMLGGGLVALSTFKTALLSIAAKVLETINFILAVIALALLVGK